MIKSRRPHKRCYGSAGIRSQISDTPAHFGHNQGPAIAREGSWHSFIWRRGRREAWKNLPIEILRLRCRRAASLGLTYRQYTSVLVDRGVHLQPMIFGLGGTLIQIKNGQAQPLPGILEKPGRLNASAIFAITDDPQAPSINAQINTLCDDCITDYGIYSNAVDAPSAILNLMAKYKIPSATVVMVGADIASENRVQT
jgi:hypothetical protein